MRDYRIPMALAVPAAIGLIAVIWILRRKSSSDDDKKRRKSHSEEKDHAVEMKDIPKVQHHAQNISEEGVTLKQRKIPEIQARDRGSSDLQSLGAPDLTVGVSTHSGRTSDVEDKGVANGKWISNSCQTVVENSLGATCLSSSQRLQVEQLVSSAIDNGLHEAKSKLQKQPSIGESVLEQSVDSGVLSGSPSSERLESFKMVEEVLLQKETAPQFETKGPVSGILEKGLTLTVPTTVKLASGSISNLDSPSTNVTEDTEVGITCLSADDIKAKPESQCQSRDSSIVRPETPSVLTAQHASNKFTEAILQKKADDVSLEGTTALILEDPVPQVEAMETTRSRAEQSPVANTKDMATNSFETSANSAATEQSSVGADNSTSTTINNSSNKRLPSERYGTRASASPWTKKSLTSTSSVDSISSFGPEEIESVWGLSSNSVTNLDSRCRLFSEDNEPSVSNIDVSSSHDQNISQNDASSPAAVLRGERETSSAESGQDNTFTPPGEDSDTKAESPAKANSPVCDNNSEGSNDSGRGGSEHDVPGQGQETLVHFDFNMPSELCGRFIGKHGKNINYLKSKTGAHVSLTNNPFTAEYQICQVVGTQAEVDDALAMIRRKFPLQDYPLLTMAPIMPGPSVPPEHPFLIPDIVQLSLPEGVSVDVYVSAIVDAGQVFVQQPTHRSFMSLDKLNHFLNLTYGQDPNVPCVPTPVECGVICVCESGGLWYRAMIMSPEDENGECQVKFVDYGGYALIPATALKQIRADFMSLPFQAVECFMANITPNQDEPFFTEEATVALSEMTQGKLLQCQVVARTENGVPYIHLYQISPESNSAVMINRALVNKQLVRWIEIL